MSAQTAQAAPADAHGRDCASASRIDLGGEATTSFADNSDRAVYKVVLEQRGLLDVWADPDALDIWAMTLLDSSCRPIRAINGGVSAISGNYARLTVPSTDILDDKTVSTLGTGAYFIQINADPTEVFGETFTIHTRFAAHYGHDFATAEPMALNGSMNGELLYSGDAEVFKVVIKQRGELEATAIGAAKDPPQLAFYLKDCTSGVESLARQSATGIATVTLDPGAYYISVAAAGTNQLGRYALTVKFSLEAPMVDPNSFDGICEFSPRP
jgi:hypothetical protein